MSLGETGVSLIVQELGPDVGNSNECLHLQ